MYATGVEAAQIKTGEKKKITMWQNCLSYLLALKKPTSDGRSEKTTEPHEFQLITNMITNHPDVQPWIPKPLQQPDEEV